MGIPLGSVSTVTREEQMIGCEESPWYLFNAVTSDLGHQVLECGPWSWTATCKLENHDQDLIIPSLHSFLPPSLPSFSFLEKKKSERTELTS